MFSVESVEPRDGLWPTTAACEPGGAESVWTLPPDAPRSPAPALASRWIPQNLVKRLLKQAQLFPPPLPNLHIYSIVNKKKKRKQLANCLVQWAGTK